jgi:hypothetical protein
MDTSKMWFYGNHNPKQYELNKNFRKDLANPIFLCNALGIVMPALPSEPNDDYDVERIVTSDDYDDKSIVTSDDHLQLHPEPSEQVGIPECDQKEITRFTEEDRDDVGVAYVSFEDNIDIPGECECRVDTQDSFSDPMTLCNIVMSPSLPSIAENDDDSIIDSDDHHDLQMNSFPQKLGKPKGARKDVQYDRRGDIPWYDERGDRRHLPRNALPSSKCDRNENHHGRMNAKRTARDTRRRTLFPTRKLKPIRNVKEKGALGRGKAGERTKASAEHFDSLQLNPRENGINDKYPLEKSHGKEHPRRIWRNPRKWLWLLSRRRKGRC